MEQALKRTIIAKDYGLSLKCFFKDCYKDSNDCYLIPINHIHHFKYINEYIIKSCSDISCSILKSCRGHQFLQFIQLLIKFEHRSVMKNKVFFGYFLFSDFKLTSDAKIKCWKITAVCQEKLHHLGYKKRLAFLRWKTLTLKNHNF